MLNIRRVILYKHGVGYFERVGKVVDDQRVDLFFRASEVSDVLKSLTVIDLDGGTVASVSYDSIKPIEELLADIAFNIPDEGSLLRLLPQLKGAEVEVQVGSETIVGTVIGIDFSKAQSADGIITIPLVALLTKAGQLQSLSLREVRSIKILDDRLQRDLEYYLKTYLAAKKKDVKQFTLFAQGTGTRQLQASYTVAMPVWKATYRIILLENSEPTIQGWAVVDNTQDEDWENIHLSLISGLPISFEHDLYTARYLRRPVVHVKEESAVAPPTMEEGIPTEFSRERSTREIVPPPQSVFDDVMAAPAAVAPAPAPGFAARRAAVSTVQVQTRERAVGDLFQYEITSPVTIKRNQSALVPIVFTKFKGRSVLLYNELTRGRNPLTCVEMENTTGLTLEGGPVTVLDGSTYVGEAMLQTMRPGDNRLIPYSVELGVLADATIDGRKERTHRVRIANGTIEASYLDIRQKVYSFHNKTAQERTIFIEHPRDTGWELFNTPEPIETTPSYFRFKAKLPAASTGKFMVLEKQERSHYYQLRNITDDELMFYTQQRYVNRPVAEALMKVLEIKRQLTELDRDLSRNETESRDIENDQKRIRENLQSLKETRGEEELRSRLVEKLMAQEDRLEQLQKAISLQRAERITLQEKIGTIIGEISFEVSLD